MTRPAGEAALGLSPHSGWAALVALGHGTGGPEVLARTRIEMADPRRRGSKQPYHEVAGWPLAKATARLERFQETAAILASHALIHTADGDHFREALAAALLRCGLSVHRVRQRELVDQAARALGKPGPRLQAEVQALGRPMGPPWGADQKSAGLLAWLLLSGRAAG